MNDYHVKFTTKGGGQWLSPCRYEAVNVRATGWDEAAQRVQNRRPDADIYCIQKR